ncbi:MAG TPA: DoxX family protein [Pseudorhizobium sp.]|jgi:uncharacterized membrane protein|nr:DoxX family protein [Pseudorhizobium sp.]
MLFFVLISFATLAARLLEWLVLSRPGSWSSAMRWGMAATLVFFGVDHLVTPERYLPMMPDVVPFHPEVVLLTGLCEIAGALGLLIPRTRRFAGVMLAIYFVCVFPANIKNALYGVNVDGLPTASLYYWVRLLFQPLAIWWALRASGVLQPNLAKKGKR